MSANNGHHRSSQSRPHVRKSIKNLAHDALELCEMQLEVIKLDSCEAVRKARTSIVLGLIALTLLLASLPVALFALAELLIETGDWSRSAALGVAALGALAISVIFALVAWRKFGQGLGSWQSSSEEFSRNIAWLKSALRSDAEADLQEGKLAEPTSRERNIH